MSTYLAKPASLDVMRECMAGGCSCFTDKGYYIQYRNGSVDSMLFVCRDCYDSKYKCRCTPGGFDEGAYQRTARTARYHRVSPALRRLLRGVRTGVRLARGACILLSLLLTCALCRKEPPQPRSCFPSHEIHLRLNTQVRGGHGISRQLDRVTDQIKRVVYSDGGDTTD